MAGKPQERRKRLDREDWILAALDVLVDQSVDAVGVEPLARRLNVTKGSFYWHFENRDDLLRAVIAHWRELATEGIIRHVEEKGGSPIDRVRRTIEIASDISATNLVGRLEIAIRAWARRDEHVRQVLIREDAARLDYLRTLLMEAGLDEAEAGLRAGLLMGFAIGERNIYRSEQKKAGRERLRQMLDFLLAEGSSSD